MRTRVRRRRGAVDLVLGGRCVGCGRARAGAVPGAATRRCRTRRSRPGRRRLRRGWRPLGGRAVRRHGPRDGRSPTRSAACFALRRPLGRLLAAATDAAGRRPGGAGAGALATRHGRSRGHDPTYAIVACGGAAPARLRARRDDRPAAACPLGGVADQAGLDAAGGRANLAGSMSCPPSALRRLAGQRRARFVVCDDVLTTGATAREAQRALEAAASRSPGSPWSRPPSARPAVSTKRDLRATAFVVRPQRLASVHGVRPGPWLRRRDALDAQGIPTASRCQSQAKRST